MIAKGVKGEICSTGTRGCLAALGELLMLNSGTTELPVVMAPDWVCVCPKQILTNFSPSEQARWDCVWTVNELSGVRGREIVP